MPSVNKESSMITGPKLSKKKLYILESFKQQGLINEYYTLGKNQRLAINNDMEFMELDISDLVSSTLVINSSFSNFKNLTIL